MDSAKRLRASLEALVSVLPLELSHYPAGYGMADERITGGNGKEWTPVIRDGPNTVAQLPLSALISEAIVAGSIAYEEKIDVALSLTGMVLKAIPAKGRLQKEFRSTAGLAALRRHGFLTVTSSGNGPIMHLTASGRRVVDAYQTVLSEIEINWRALFGSEIIVNLRAALEDINRS